MSRVASCELCHRPFVVAHGATACDGCSQQADQILASFKPKRRRLIGWRVRWVCADLDIRSGITTLIDAWRIARELRRSPKNEGVRIVRVYLVRRGK